MPIKNNENEIIAVVQVLNRLKNNSNGEIKSSGFDDFDVEVFLILT
jgi:hypothetical protein